MDPFHEGSTLMTSAKPNYLLKAPPTKIITWAGGRVSMYKSVGPTYVVCNNWLDWRQNSEWLSLVLPAWRLGRILYSTCTAHLLPRCLYFLFPHPPPQRSVPLRTKPGVALRLQPLGISAGFHVRSPLFSST